MSEQEAPTVTAIEDLKQTIRKYCVADTKTLKNGDVEAYVSTETVDRVGDILKASGWRLDTYRKTGSPVLFGHEYGLTAAGIPHIGNAIEMEVQRKGLWSVTRFHEKTQLSREAAVLAREKILPAWSVGFNPMGRPEARKDDDGNFLGYIYDAQELLEYSLVLVPANPDAVSRAMHLAEKGAIRTETVYRIAGPSPLATEGSEPAVEAQVRAVEPDVSQLAEALIGGLQAFTAAKLLRSKGRT